jgi:hypothetical protein
MSATTTHTSGRNKELQFRAIGPDMIVTPDSGGILLEKDTLKLIANSVSGRLNRKLIHGEIDQLVKFIRELPQQQFYQKPLSTAIDRISNLFVNRHRNTLNSYPRDTGSVDGLARINEITDDGTVSDYLHQEALQTSDNENQYKWTAHPDRRGNAVIDRDRVNGLRSSPDNVAPHPASQAQMFERLSSCVQSIGKVMNPDFIDNLFKRANASLLAAQNFQGIVLPRRTVPLDSLNRDLADPTSNVIKWYLNVAGRPGSVGNIQIQDTLQQVIRVSVSPFWLPISNPIDLYYSTIRMNIREFWQRAEVTDYFGSNQSQAIQSGYHFQFKITQVEPNRVFLVPENLEYTFSKPVAQIDSLTLEFKNPFQPVVLDTDRGTYTVTYGNPTLFTLTSGTNNNLSTGDIVYVLNFTSANTSINDQLNSADGLSITKISNTQFTVAVDSSSLGAGTLTGVQVLYGSKRVFLQLEFISLEH